MSEPIVVGIDVTRETVEACWADRDYSFANDDAGHQALIAALSPCAVDLIVMEATGRHEAACACALQTAGFAVAMVSPRQVREFASPMGQLARADRVEARLLQRFAALLANRPDRRKYVRVVPGEELRALQALVARRRQLLEMLAAERDRLAASHRAARPSIEAVLRALRGQLEPIDKQLGRHLPSLAPFWLRAPAASRTPGAPPGRRSAHAK